jgi:predicted nucleic acid-binding protein
VNFVLDASIALSWCFEDEGEGQAVLILERLLQEEAVVPSLWALEVTNGLLTAERRGRLDAAAVSRGGNLLLSLPIVMDPMARSRPFAVIQPLARQHRLSTYDAAYLELAIRKRIPLASLDNGLTTAARKEGLEVLDGE